MLKNYLTTSLRTLFKHRVYSLINILGLSVGLTCAILLLLFVRQEQQFDRFHEKADRVFRVVTEVHTQNGQITNIAYSPIPLAQTLVETREEVEAAVRFTGREVVMHRNETQHLEALYFVDDAFFEVFSFKLLHGDPATALVAPQSLVITQEMAERFFEAGEDPLGQTLRFGDGLDTWDWTITGVLAEPPPNSHIEINALASFSTLPLSRQQEWGRLGLWTYIMLAEGTSPEAFEASLPDFMAAQAGDWARDMLQLHLQPLTSIYFDSDLLAEIGPTGDRTYVYVFSAIGLLVLLIACINFMNLSTARSLHRAREVGVRKVFGAHRGQLVQQFLSESCLMVALAFVFALVLVQLSLPVFSELAGRELVIHWHEEGGLLLLAMIAVGLISGSYPAFYLSAFLPVAVLKGQVVSRGIGQKVRQGLVVLQFGISIVLLIGTLTVYNQLQYTQQKTLGFEETQVVTVRLDPMRNQGNVLKEALLQYASVEAASAASVLPGMPVAPRPYGYEGLAEGTVLVNTAFVDVDYQKMLALELAAGRFFRADMGTDTSAFVINEAAVAHFGWGSAEEAIGKSVEAQGATGRSGHVVGVVKDYHYASLHAMIQPLILREGANRHRILGVRVRGAEMIETLGFIEEKWGDLFPDQPIVTSFLNESLERQYQQERRFGALFGYFAGIAIVIACLGLLGLAAFTAEQRTKEIGVRKVLGASVSGVVALLSREYVVLVLVANVLAWPVAYFVMDRWLQTFAYHIELSGFVFLASGVVALSIAVLTVSYQSLRAALVNPVDALRYE